MFGALVGVEKFTSRKFMGVMASLVGIILISRVDLSKSDKDSNNSAGMRAFPHKSSAEIALGDAMAAFSSIMYGIYTIVMKKQVGDESRVNMQLFFGLVGLFNLVMLWPGFFILHWTGVELFELPNTKHVWTIVLVWLIHPIASPRCWPDGSLISSNLRSIRSPLSSLTLHGLMPCS